MKSIARMVSLSAVGLAAAGVMAVAAPASAAPASAAPASAAPASAAPAHSVEKAAKYWKVQRVLYASDYGGIQGAWATCKRYKKIWEKEGHTMRCRGYSGAGGKAVLLERYY